MKRLGLVLVPLAGCTHVTTIGATSVDVGWWVVPFVFGAIFWLGACRWGGR